MMTFICTLKQISKPYPRKGTETATLTAQTQTATEFQNHIPARGRKLFSEPTCFFHNILISKPYPRKGTETA